MPDREFKVLITGDASGVASASRAGGEALEGMGKAGAAAHKEIATAAEHGGIKHKELHAIVKGLKLEFPELAHIAHFALNPITLMVAGITGAFAIWTSRVRELNATFAQAELPAVSPMQIGHINAATEAWKNYGEAIRKVKEAYDSVDAAADRHAKKSAEEVERQKKLLAANKALELSKLEGGRGSMSEGEYEARKLEIENRYSKAGLAVDESARKKAIADKAAKSESLITDAESKAEEAAKIKIASAEDDKITEEDMKRQADVAQQEIAERERRIRDVQDLQTGEGSRWQNIQTNWRLAMTGLSEQEAMSMEHEGIDQAKIPIQRYQEFLRRRLERGEARKRRAGLLGESAKEVGEAAQIQAELPGDAASANADASTNRRVAAMQSLGRAHEAAGTLARDAQARADQIKSLVEAGKGVDTQIMSTLKDLTAWKKAMEGDIESLKHQLANPMH